MHTSNSSQVQEKKGQEDVNSTNKNESSLCHIKKTPSQNKQKTPRSEGNSNISKHLKMTEVLLCALINLQYELCSNYS